MMKARNYQLMGMAAVLVLWITGCKEKKNENHVLARVNGVELTSDQYKGTEFYYTRFSHLALTNPDQRLQAMVESEVLYQEAENQRIDDSPEVQQQIHQILIAALLKRELTNKLNQSQPTEAEARAYYDANTARFRSPETIHYAHILISLPDKKAAEALANKLLKDPEINQPTGFGKLALENRVWADRRLRHLIWFLFHPLAESFWKPQRIWRRRPLRNSTAHTAIRNCR